MGLGLACFLGSVGAAMVVVEGDRNSKGEVRKVCGFDCRWRRCGDPTKETTKFVAVVAGVQ